MRRCFSPLPLLHPSSHPCSVIPVKKSAHYPLDWLRHQHPIASNCGEKKKTAPELVGRTYEKKRAKSLNVINPATRLVGRQCVCVSIGWTGCHGDPSHECVVIEMYPSSPPPSFRLPPRAAELPLSLIFDSVGLAHAQLTGPSFILRYHYQTRKMKWLDTPHLVLFNYFKQSLRWSLKKLLHTHTDAGGAIVVRMSPSLQEQKQLISK